MLIYDSGNIWVQIIDLGCIFSGKKRFPIEVGSVVPRKGREGEACGVSVGQSILENHTNKTN